MSDDRDYKSEWQTFNLEDVVRYFINGFNIPEDREIAPALYGEKRWWIDPASGTLIIRLDTWRKKP